MSIRSSASALDAPANSARSLAKGARLRSLYAHEFPLIADALTRLADQISIHHPAITLVVLFGSVARLTPHRYSDTDLLILFDLDDAIDPRACENMLDQEFNTTMMNVVYAEGRAWPRWGISVVTSDARANDLDADFLSVVGGEGVLLYQRAGTPPPPPLDHLRPFADWLAHLPTAHTAAR